MSITDYRTNLGALPRCGKPHYEATHTYRCLARGVHGVHFDQLDDQPTKEWSYNGTGNILRNRAACMSCGEVVESTHRHDFRLCSCGSVHVDGGNDYLKRGFKPGVGFADMSLHVPRLRAEAKVAQAARLGWLDPGAACGSCGSCGEPFENQPYPTVNNTYFAPECPSCSLARQEAVVFIGTHLRVVRDGAVPGGAACPYRHTCDIYMKNECPRVDDGAPFSCAVARGLAGNYPRVAGR